MASECDPPWTHGHTGPHFDAIRVSTYHGCRMNIRVMVKVNVKGALHQRRSWSRFSWT